MRPTYQKRFIDRPEKLARRQARTVKAFHIARLGA